MQLSRITRGLSISRTRFPAMLRPFTFGSVVFTLSDQPTLRVPAGPPDRQEYVTLGFEKDK